MIHENDKIELSFYQLSLLSFLTESHPELSENKKFIKNRAKSASKAFEDAFNSGEDTQECVRIATKTLYEGLHFSLHDTITTVLWNEFPREVTLSDGRECAIRLRQYLDPIIKKYTITDNFADSDEYQSLYTEIVGAVQLKLEEDGKL